MIRSKKKKVDPEKRINLLTTIASIILVVVFVYLLLAITGIIK